MQGIFQCKAQDEDTKTMRQRYLCPFCNKHTVLWLLPTTRIKDLPVKCKRCGTESVINIMPELEI